MDKTLDELLDVFASHEEKRKARESVEALCILDGFREEEIPPFIATYRIGNVEQAKLLEAQISQQDVREIRDRLTAAHLAHWEDGAYHITEAVRHVAEQYLQNRQSNMWRRLHATRSDSLSRLCTTVSQMEIRVSWRWQDGTRDSDYFLPIKLFESSRDKDSVSKHLFYVAV